MGNAEPALSPPVGGPHATHPGRSPCRRLATCWPDFSRGFRLHATSPLSLARPLHHGAGPAGAQPAGLQQGLDQDAPASFGPPAWVELSASCLEPSLMLDPTTPSWRGPLGSRQRRSSAGPGQTARPHDLPPPLGWKKNATDDANGSRPPRLLRTFPLLGYPPFQMFTLPEHRGL